MSSYSEMRISRRLLARTGPASQTRECFLVLAQSALG